MKFVAVVRAPERPEEAAKVVAAATGLTLAEVRMRLAPEPPALLARLPPEAAEALVAALSGAGVAALAADAAVPTDAGRTIVARLELTDLAATFTPVAGERLVVPWPEVLAILRGMRTSRTDVERTEKKRSFSVGMAVATGGLRMSRQSEKTVRSSEESAEQVILVYTRDGKAALLSERRLDVSCLGPGLHPSSAANMAAVARMLRERARSAFYDERLLRLGRRPLPFVLNSEFRIDAGASVATRSDTRASLDVLAEVLRQAVVAGLLR